MVKKYHSFYSSFLLLSANILSRMKFPLRKMTCWKNGFRKLFENDKILEYLEYQRIISRPLHKVVTYLTIKSKTKTSVNNPLI